MSKRKKYDDFYTVSSEPPQEEESPEPVVPAVPAEPLPQSVDLKTFLVLCGYRKENTAGFRSYAQRNNLGPRPVIDWHAAYQLFLNSPVR